MQIIIRCMAIYFGVGTFILINLLFNNRFQIYAIDKETKEIKCVPHKIYVIISLFWIIIIPHILLNREKE